MPSTTSPRLCGGMLVAIPTAIPVPPFTRRFGKAEGNTVGSVCSLSYVGTKSTVSLSKSAIRATPMPESLASVYRAAAGGSPSGVPKLPWPITRISRMDQSCAMFTRVP